MKHLLINKKSLEYLAGPKFKDYKELRHFNIKYTFVTSFLARHELQCRIAGTTNSEAKRPLSLLWALSNKKYLYSLQFMQMCSYSD